MQSKNIHFVYLFILFVLIIFSVVNIFLGLHNIDIGYNLLNLEKDTGTTWIDKSLGGIIQTSDQIYNRGMLQVHTYSIVGILSTFLFAYSIKFRSDVNDDARK